MGSILGQVAGPSQMRQHGGSAHSAIRHPRVIMHLLRSLYFFPGRVGYSVVGDAGIQKTSADAISRNYLQVFRREAPTAEEAPAMIPTPIRQPLVTEHPDWTSSAWRSKFQQGIAPSTSRTYVQGQGKYLPGLLQTVEAGPDSRIRRSTDFICCGVSPIEGYKHN